MADFGNFNDGVLIPGVSSLSSIDTNPLAMKFNFQDIKKETFKLFNTCLNLGLQNDEPVELSKRIDLIQSPDFYDTRLHRSTGKKISQNRHPN